MGHPGSPSSPSSRTGRLRSRFVTPRQQDVAFVLESVPGVLDVYAVARAGVDLEFAVQLEHGTGKLAAAHYALLRVLKREECSRILFFETQLPPGLTHAVTRLELSTVERNESRVRVPERAPDEPSPPKRVRSGAQFAALLVGCTGEVYRSVVAGLGVAARRVIESDPRVGAERALAEEFDVLLCAARVAFGRLGFLQFLHAQDPFLVPRVILVAAPRERDLAIARLEESGRYNTCLATPVDPALILEIARTGFVVLPWSIPVPPARGTLAAQRATEPSAPRVLVVDDHLETQALDTDSPRADFKIDIAQDPWTALDYLALEPPDLILCSASLKAGTTPVYRLLWDAHPELKARFMLVASSQDLDDGRGRQRLVQRPLTRERIAEALGRSGRL